MALLATILGFRSSRTEISDDEGSVSSGARTPVKPAKVQRKSKSREVEEEPLNVESDKEEEEEEDDEEDVGEDEYARAIVFVGAPS